LARFAIDRLAVEGRLSLRRVFGEQRQKEFVRFVGLAARSFKQAAQDVVGYRILGLASGAVRRDSLAAGESDSFNLHQEFRPTDVRNGVDDGESAKPFLADGPALLEILGAFKVYPHFGEIFEGCAGP
jgi:hypothetical protein